MARKIEVTGCEDCPHCDLFQQSSVGRYVVQCRKMMRTEIVTGDGFPAWCPLPPEPYEREQRMLGFRLPDFLKRQAL